MSSTPRKPLDGCWNKKIIIIMAFAFAIQYANVWLDVQDYKLVDRLVRSFYLCGGARSRHFPPLHAVSWPDGLNYAEATGLFRISGRL
jgi:hypothetical protein